MRTKEDESTVEARHEETSLSDDSNALDQQIDDEVPDGGYGWVCVGCVFCLNGFTWGIVASFSVFLAYYLENDVFPGATPLEYSFVGGLNFAMSLGLAPFITIMCRHMPIQIPMLIGVALQLLGYILASFAKEAWQLFLTQGALVGAGIGFIYIPSTPVISQWFSKRRSLANGIVAGGSGVGGLVASFATQPLINNVSLGWALRAIGLIAGGVNLVATLLIRTRNQHVQPAFKPFDVTLFRDIRVVLMTVWAVVMMFGYTVLLFSLPDSARAAGLSESQASLLAGFQNLGTLFGRPIIGQLSDRYGRIEVAGVCTALTAVTAFAIWIPAQALGVWIFLSIVNGAILGVYWATQAPISAEIVGLRRLPSLLSVSWLLVVPPTTFSEAIGLALRQPIDQNSTSGSSAPSYRYNYLYAQLFSGITYTVAAVALYAMWVIHKRRLKEAAALRESESPVEREEVTATTEKS